MMITELYQDFFPPADVETLSHIFENRSHLPLEYPFKTRFNEV